MRYPRFMIRMVLIALMVLTSANVAGATSYTSAPTVNPGASVAPVAAPVPMTGPEIFSQQIGPEQLRSMLTDAVQKDPTYKMILVKHGKTVVETRLNYEVRKAAAQNQQEWNDNLAQSYEGLLEPKEWVQIVNKTPGAAVKRKFPQAMMTAGQRMQTLSQPLMQDMTAQVVRRLAGAFPR